jgi:hypothetical protein
MWEAQNTELTNHYEAGNKQIQEEEIQMEFGDNVNFNNNEKQTLTVTSEKDL